VRIWKILSWIIVILVLTEIVRYTNIYLQRGQERKIHSIERCAYDDFFFKLLRILPNETSTYEESLIFENQNIGVFSASIMGKGQVILHDKIANEVETIFPYLSDEMIKRYVESMNGIENARNNMDFTMMNTNAFNRFLQEKEVCNTSEVVLEYFNLRKLISNEVLIHDFVSLSKKSLSRKVINQFMSEHSLVGDTAVYFEDKFTIGEDLCRYDFDIVDCRITNIQVSCVSEVN